MALQNFEIKKAVYEAEIAKNIAENRTTAKFSKSANEYFTAKRLIQQRADELFPPISEEENPATETVVSSTTASTTTVKH